VTPCSLEDRYLSIKLQVVMFHHCLLLIVITTEDTVIWDVKTCGLVDRYWVYIYQTAGCHIPEDYYLY